MTRSLLIAPQWIGDAVMTEPLLRVMVEAPEAALATAQAGSVASAVRAAIA